MNFLVVMGLDDIICGITHFFLTYMPFFKFNTVIMPFLLLLAKYNNNANLRFSLLSD